LIFWQIEAILKKYKSTLRTPVKDVSKEAIDMILNGSEESFKIENTALGISSKIELSFDGIYSFIDRHASGDNANARKIKENYYSQSV
jgi:excinuclease ABC subunit A